MACIQSLSDKLSLAPNGAPIFDDTFIPDKVFAT